MGVVYLGVTWDGSPVAVKVLRPELADDQEFRHRFRHEVSALTRVRGVCTVRVIEADTESPRPFMVTEYAEGPSLAEYIDTHGLVGPDMLYGLATGLAEALTVIHRAGVVHRDLKPSNVILTDAGPKVIDFGIAQALDATSMTKTGMMVGSAGFMAPEQVSGHPGPAADIFVWGVTVAYAASGQPPFGIGDTHAILYRVIHGDPDISGVPQPLRPLVAAALAKDPDHRPTARQLLDQLTSTAVRSPRVQDSPTQTVLATTWQRTGPHPGGPGASRAAGGAEGSLLLDPAPPGSGPPVPRPRRAGRGPVSRRAKTAAVAALVVAAAVAAIVIATVPGGGPRTDSTTAIEGGAGTLAPASASALPTYPGQQSRAVFQTISRIVASGNTMVTTGSQVTDGVARQQFFASPDAGNSWRLAPVQLPGGGQPPLGYPATRIAGGPRGWAAVGPSALWTSPDGLSWTLAATHGITPRQPGDSVNVVTSTPGGFLAGGNQQTSSGPQAVIWISRDGVTWQRLTAAQLGLTTGGVIPHSIDFATSRGSATVISDGQAGVWLSTNSGLTWTPVTVPLDHGAQNSISGVSFDGSGLIAVRPGLTASGAPDGVAYFSPDGRAWQYAGTVGAAGGWRPDVVKGSDYGFVVTGRTGNQYVAYTSTGTGTTWRPTGPLGDSSSGPELTATVGPGSAVIAAGNTNRTRTGQQALIIKADTAGHLQPVPLAAIPGGLIPEVAVNSTAVAGSAQIAVGSANGYPAVWRRVAGGSWALVSPLSVASADPALTGLSAVTRGSAGWLAVGPGPVVLTSADGMTWRSAGAIAQDLAGVSAVRAASGPRGYVIVGKVVQPDGTGLSDVWWSRDLASWTKARDVNGTSGSSQMLTVAAGPSGFVSAGSYEDQPAVWTSSDGRAWTTIRLPVPEKRDGEAGGASAGAIQQVAIDGSRVVALGRQTTASGPRPLAELSTDGGLTWQLVPFSPPGPDTVITALTAGPGGFTAAVQFSATSGALDAAVWTSANGASWTRSALSGLTGGGSHDLSALAPSGSAVTGIDSVQTQAGQQFVVRRLPGG